MDTKAKMAIVNIFIMIINVYLIILTCIIILTFYLRTSSMLSCISLAERVGLTSAKSTLHLLYKLIKLKSKCVPSHGSRGQYFCLQ